MEGGGERNKRGNMIGEDENCERIKKKSSPLLVHFVKK